MSARLTVYANSNKPVPAKYLEINGEVIRGPSGDPYIVPADFDWNTYMGKFEKLRHSLETAENVDRSHPDEIVRAGGYTSMVYTFLYDQFHAAWPGRPGDVQRTYNGYAGKGEGDFVAAFTPAASFLYGAACAALGLGEEECLAGGGAQNILSAIAARRATPANLPERRSTRPRSPPAPPSAAHSRKFLSHQVDLHPCVWAPRGPLSRSHEKTGSHPRTRLRVSQRHSPTRWLTMQIPVFLLPWRTPLSPGWTP